MVDWARINRQRKQKQMANWKAINERAHIAQLVCQRYGVQLVDLMKAGPVPVSPNARSGHQQPDDPRTRHLSAAWLEYCKLCSQKGLLNYTEPTEADRAKQKQKQS